MVLSFYNFKSKQKPECTLSTDSGVSIRNLCSTPDCLDESLSDLQKVISPLFANYRSCMEFNTSSFSKRSSIHEHLQNSIENSWGSVPEKYHYLRSERKNCARKTSGGSVKRPGDKELV